jgi:hypothetical protein
MARQKAIFAIIPPVDQSIYRSEHWLIKSTGKPQQYSPSRRDRIRRFAEKRLRGLAEAGGDG